MTRKTVLHKTAVFHKNDIADMVKELVNLGAIEGQDIIYVTMALDLMFENTIERLTKISLRALFGNWSTDNRNGIQRAILILYNEGLLYRIEESIFLKPYVLQAARQEGEKHNIDQLMQQQQALFDLLDEEETDEV